MGGAADGRGAAGEAAGEAAAVALPTATIVGNDTVAVEAAATVAATVAVEAATAGAIPKGHTVAQEAEVATNIAAGVHDTTMIATGVVA